MAELAADRPDNIPALTFTEARARFTEIVGRAEYAKSPTVITKRGREVAVVMPIEALAYFAARPTSGVRKPLEETLENLAAIGAEANITHEEVIAALRAIREEGE